MKAQHTWRACVAAMLFGGTLCRAFLAARPTPSVARPSCVIARRQQLGVGSGVHGLVVRVKGDQWWGTKDSIAWEKALLSATASPSPGSDTAFICHPCAHIAWTRAFREVDSILPTLHAAIPAAVMGRGVVGGATGSRLPGAVNFAQLNSAQRSLLLPVDWVRVRTVALALEHGTRGSLGGGQAVGKEAPLICWVREAAGAAGGGGGWDDACNDGSQPLYLEVADVASLEIALAHALTDIPVLAHILPCDIDEGAEREGGSGGGTEGDKKGGAGGSRGRGGTGKVGEGSVGMRAGETRVEEAVKGVDGLEPGADGREPGVAPFRQGWSQESLQGKHVVGFLSTAVVRNSRDKEPCCWPKVWMFAKRLLHNHPDAWTESPKGLGYVPVKWDESHAQWVAGNRHRVMAACVAGVPFLARARATQYEGHDVSQYLPVSWSKTSSSSVDQAVAMPPFGDGRGCGSGGGEGGRGGRRW